MTKHQADCYRTFGGEKWMNYGDILSDEHMAEVKAMQAAGTKIKLRKHPDGYYQAFIKPEGE